MNLNLITARHIDRNCQMMGYNHQCGGSWSEKTKHDIDMEMYQLIWT